MRQLLQDTELLALDPGVYTEELLAECVLAMNRLMRGIDVERQELPALQSSDWDRFRPTLVLVEILNRTVLEQLQEDCVHQFMMSEEYELVAKTMRTAFYWKLEARR